MINKKVAHMSIDSDVAVKLFVYATYGKQIMPILEANDYTTQDVADMVSSNYYLSQEFYYRNSKNGPICNQLYYIAKLYKLLKNDELKLYITPTVMGELGLFTDTHVDSTVNANEKQALSRTNFMQKFLETQSNVYVLTVPDDMKYKFEYDVLLLAKQYMSSHAMQREYSPVVRSYVPSTDAFIVAESSIFGLTVMTFNEQHFMHRNFIRPGVKGDFRRAEQIEEINALHGLKFKTNTKKKRAPRPIAVHGFIDKFYNEQNESNKKFCTYPNIDAESGEIIPAVLGVE